MDLSIILLAGGRFEDKKILDAVFYAGGLVWDFFGRSVHRSVAMGVLVED